MGVRSKTMVTMLAAAVALSACGVDDQTDDTDTEDADAVEPSDDDEGAEEPSDDDEGAEEASGGTLVAAISGDPGSLNPAITTSGIVHTASELMFNGLVDVVDGEVVPALAESWDIEDDGALYRFHLRDGVTWHDGEPFTAADVVFTFEEVLFEFHSRTAASLGNAIDEIVAVDDTTVEFRFPEGYGPLLLQLDHVEAPIVPKHVYEGTDILENEANTAPIGTGPFAFASYDADAEIRLVRNDNYFEEGLPHVDEVVLRIIPDEGTALAALETGEVDFLFSAPGPELDRLEADPAFEFLRTAVNPGGSNCIMTLSFNLDRVMFDDVRTRRAIGHAIDRDQFIERVTFGQGRVAQAPIHSNIAFAHAPEVELPEFDRDAAAALLDEVGWVRDGDGVRTAQGVGGIEDGTELTFEFLAFPIFGSYGELLRAQLEEVGIEVILDTQEPPVFIETVFTDRAFDTNVVSYCNGPDPEIGVRRMYLSSNIAPIPFSNSSAYVNEQVDAMFDDAVRTVDPDARGEIYAAISEQLAEDLPYLWLVETESTRVFTADCREFEQAGHFAKTARCG